MGIGRIGQDFVVNTRTPGDQVGPSVAGLADGGFVIVFQSDFGDGDATGIRARLYNADGTSNGTDFLINSYITGNQFGPAVTAPAYGGFVAAWSRDTGGDIRIGILDSDGTLFENKDFTVSDTLTGNLQEAAITALKDGRYLVTWHDNTNSVAGHQIRGSIVSADVAIGNDFRIDTTAADEVKDSSVTELGNGRFLVTWEFYDGAQRDIRGRIFSYNDSFTVIPAGNDFLINHSTSLDQTRPAVATLAGGRFIVTWESSGDIFGRIFNANGTTSADDILINTTLSGSQQHSSVAALADGRFVVTWFSGDAGDASGTCIRARLYNVDSTASGNDFIVNTTTANDQTHPTVAALADGRFVVTWQSADPGDGSGSCIRAQLFDPTKFTGTAAADIWQGGNLADTISGGPGGDTLFGLDGADSINGDSGNDMLFGGAGNDKLFGGGENDLLNGGTGADLMAGGRDDDTYVVDNSADIIVELGGQGIDSVQSSASYVLSLNVEKLTLTGGAANGTGNAFSNEITGNAAANVLNGGGGADTMHGSAGNDIYVVDNAGDIVDEAGFGGAGVDTVRSTVTVSFADTTHYKGTLENIVLVGSAGISAVGNGFANVIDGSQNSAANLLRGMAGNDTYIVGPGDVVDESVAGSAGVDSVRSAIISINLGDTVHYRGALENILLLGSASLAATGNAANNSIVGNAGANTLSGLGGNDALSGGSGNDTLIGGLGIDTLTGGANNDVFVFNAPVSAANRDVITDFANLAGNNDSFRLDNAVMPALGGVGALNPGYFFAGAAAHDINDHIIYNRATGALVYDSNGDLAGGATLLATLLSKPILNSLDFAVI